MLLLDAMARYSTVTILLLLAFLALRDGRAFRPSKFLVALAVSTSAMLVAKAQTDLLLPDPISLGVQIIGLGSIIFVWWFGLSFFDDDFRLGWIHWGVLIAVACIQIPIKIANFSGSPVDTGLIYYALDILYLSLMAHLIFVALKGRADDLVEPRRRLRIIFVIAMAIATSLTILADTLLKPLHPDFLLTLRALIIFPLALWGFTWLSQLKPDGFIFEKPGPVNRPDTSVDPRDKLLLDNLMQVMENENKYREARLSIRDLAEDLGTPEHRLRELINKGLGYSNFRAFLNSYRIKAVKDAFARPENSRIPVLTIAMDVGFNSLAPFNRAFRQSEGMTPSDYRKTVVF